MWSLSSGDHGDRWLMPIDLCVRLAWVPSIRSATAVGRAALSAPAHGDEQAALGPELPDPAQLRQPALGPPIVGRGGEQNRPVEQTRERAAFGPRAKRVQAVAGRAPNRRLAFQNVRVRETATLLPKSSWGGAARPGNRAQSAANDSFSGC
jgi:hypothetical protein